MPTSNIQSTSTSQPFPIHFSYLRKISTLQVLFYQVIDQLQLDQKLTVFPSTYHLFPLKILYAYLATSQALQKHTIHVLLDVFSMSSACIFKNYHLACFAELTNLFIDKVKKEDFSNEANQGLSLRPCLSAIEATDVKVIYSVALNIFLYLYRPKDTLHFIAMNVLSKSVHLAACVSERQWEKAAFDAAGIAASFLCLPPLVVALDVGQWISSRFK